jgi:hypothetical protein
MYVVGEAQKLRVRNNDLSPLKHFDHPFHSLI